MFFNSPFGMKGGKASNVFETHCVKSVQIWSFFLSVFSSIWAEYGKHGPELTPYLDIFHSVTVLVAFLGSGVFGKGLQTGNQLEFLLFCCF